MSINVSFMTKFNGKLRGEKDISRLSLGRAPKDLDVSS